MTDTVSPDNDPFIADLIKICTDRGSAAALRRFWSPATRHYAYPVLGRLRVANPKLPDAILAALYAVNPHHTNGGLTLGKACLKLAGESGFESFEHHMKRLLASNDLPEVGGQLQRILKRLERNGITLDYNKLAWNLRNWPKKSDEVKTEWAMHFWQAPATQSTLEVAKT